MNQYKCNIKNMTLENYAKLFNEELYPLNYPYYLRVGARSEQGKLSAIVQIGIPIEQEGEFDIDAPTKYNFQDIITLYGDSDEEVIHLIENVEFHPDHKQYFKSLWNKE